MESVRNTLNIATQDIPLVDYSQLGITTGLVWNKEEIVVRRFSESTSSSTTSSSVYSSSSPSYNPPSSPAYPPVSPVYFPSSPSSNSPGWRKRRRLMSYNEETEEEIPLYQRRAFNITLIVNAPLTLNERFTRLAAEYLERQSTASSTDTNFKEAAVDHWAHRTLDSRRSEDTTIDLVSLSDIYSNEASPEPVLH